MTKRVLRSMGGESPADRARRLAGVAWAGYEAGWPDGFPMSEMPGTVFCDAYWLGYHQAIADMVEIEEPRKRQRSK